MSEITLSVEESPAITLIKNEDVITLTTETDDIVISQKGIKGDQGIQGIQGIQGPVGPPSWNDFAGDVQYTGIEAVIPSGEVLTAEYEGDTIYRFINSTTNVNGYPLEDSFYSNFDGTNLTDLIVTRG